MSEVDFFLSFADLVAAFLLDVGVGVVGFLSFLVDMVGVVWCVCVLECVFVSNS